MCIIQYQRPKLNCTLVSGTVSGVLACVAVLRHPLLGYGFRNCNMEVVSVNIELIPLNF